VGNNSELDALLEDEGGVEVQVLHIRKQSLRRAPGTERAE